MKLFTKSGLTATFCLSLCAASQAGLVDWALRGPSGFVTSGKKLTLNNLSTKQNLKYGSRTFGINLEWTKAVYLGNVQIFHRKTDNLPIIYGERVAVYIKDGGYLKYERRTTGINLGWSKEPVFQWKLGSVDGNIGDRMKVNDRFCLLNTTAKDCVIYDTRRFGINLVWAKDEGKMGWGDLLAEIGRLAGKPSTALSNWISGETD
jgi:hypothetical protein